MEFYLGYPRLVLNKSWKLIIFKIRYLISLVKRYIIGVSEQCAQQFFPVSDTMDMSYHILHNCGPWNSGFHALKIYKSWKSGNVLEFYSFTSLEPWYMLARPGPYQLAVI